jgi:membrane fusion protein
MSDNDSSSLFRREVLAAQSDSAPGQAMAIGPLRGRYLTAFLVLLCGAIVTLLVLGAYTAKETVQGVVQPVAGVSSVTSPEAGLVRKLLVQEGQRVKAGDVLAELSNERFSDAGNTGRLVEQQLHHQKAQVTAQSEGQGQAQQAALSGLDERIAQARRDMTSLTAEMQLQTQQEASSRKLFEQLAPLKAENIVSDLQYEQQRQSLLEQSARLQTLRRQLSGAQADLAQALDERKRLGAQHQVEKAELERQMLGLEQELVQRRGANTIVLKAPTDGTVSGLSATPGQYLAAGALLASVVPSHSAMQAVLYVPSTAMGFIQAGQTVRIRYDAFPHQRFGQYRGVVRSVSSSDVAPPGGQTSSADPRARFMVRVDLDTPYVNAYGKQVPLRSGHTLSADIELDRRPLIRWLFDPLAAFSGAL